MCAHIARARVASMNVCTVCGTGTHMNVVCMNVCVHVKLYVCTDMYECMNVHVPYQVIYKILYTYLSPVLPQNRP